MTIRVHRTLATLLLLASATLLPPAQAGAPLLCQHTDGTALDWQPQSTADASADADRLIADVLRLLDHDLDVLARMEVVRRATLRLGDLAGRRPAILGGRKSPPAERLLAELVARSRAEGATPAALFDAGYLAATFAQAGFPTEVDGYALVTAALAKRPDPAMELAAAIICIHPARPEREAHLLRAIAGAAEGSPLADSIEAHAERWGWGTLADLRARAASRRS